MQINALDQIPVKIETVLCSEKAKMLYFIVPNTEKWMNKDESSLDSNTALCSSPYLHVRSAAH